MGDSPEERRSKDVVPETAAKEAETGKGKKEKKEKSAEGTKPVSWADKWRNLVGFIDSTKPNATNCHGDRPSGNLAGNDLMA